MKETLELGCYEYYRYHCPYLSRSSPHPATGAPKQAELRDHRNQSGIKREIDKNVLQMFIFQFTSSKSRFKEPRSESQEPRSVPDKSELRLGAFKLSIVA